MVPFLKTCGFLLTFLAGIGFGWELSLRQTQKWEQMHTFLRLVGWLQQNIQYRALPAEDLLRLAGAVPAFAALGLSGCRCLEEIPPPAVFEPGLRQEIADAFAAAAASPRGDACAALGRLGQLCAEAETRQEHKARETRSVYPKLGGCLGLMAAILFL